MPLSTQTLLLRIHQALGFVLRRAGFRFEIRRTGEFRLGLWRKKIRSTRQPRRMVFVPGFGDTPLSWASVFILLIPTLRRNYDEIILLDFPGFLGFLSREPACESMDYLTAAVISTLDSLKPHTVMGHSLGGWLAAEYAVHAGKQKKNWLKQILLICPSGVFGTHEERQAVENRFRLAATEGFQHLREVLFAREPRHLKWVMAGFSQFIQRHDIVRFLQSFEPRHDIRSELSAIDCQVNLIWGELDQMVPSHWHRDWLRALNVPGKAPVSALLLKGVGHSPQIEARRPTALAIKKILNGESLSPLRGAKASKWEWVVSDSLF